MAGAPAEEPIPSLPPLPRTVPVVPLARPAVVDGDELPDRLDSEVRTRDKAIDQVLAGPLAAAPRPPDLRQPATAAAAKDQARARKELADALSAWEARGSRRGGDVLDRGQTRVVAAQVAPLEAANLLAIAECCKDLAGSAEGTVADLDAGQQAIERLDASRLSDADQPRALYLKLWFQLERLRVSPPASAAEQEKSLAAARATATELANRHGESPLAKLAPALFSGISLTAAGSPPP